MFSRSNDQRQWDNENGHTLPHFITRSKILLQIVYILLSFQNISTEKSELFAILDY
jgi:hypothetical protein